MYDIIIEDLNLDGIYSIAELNKNCSFTLRYQSEPSTCLTWTYMFLLLCFLNKDKTIQEIADYWGWKIGKYKGEGNIEEYLNDKVKSFSIFMLEYSKYEGDYDENGWQEYVYSLVSTADGDVYSEITIPINVYLSYNKKFKYDFYSEWSSNTNKILAENGLMGAFPFREIDKKSPNFINACKKISCGDLEDFKIIEIIYLKDEEENEEYLPKLETIIVEVDGDYIEFLSESFTDKDKNIYLFDVDPYVLKRNAVIT